MKRNPSSHSHTVNYVTYHISHILQFTSVKHSNSHCSYCAVISGLHILAEAFLCRSLSRKVSIVGSRYAMNILFSACRSAKTLAASVDGTKLRLQSTKWCYHLVQEPMSHRAVGAERRCVQEPWSKSATRGTLTLACYQIYCMVMLENRLPGSALTRSLPSATLLHVQSLVTQLLPKVNQK